MAGTPRAARDAPDGADDVAAPAGVSARVVALREAIAAASDIGRLAAVAAEAPELAARSIGEGFAADATTALVTALADEITMRATALVAAETGVDFGQACWLAFGSQARREQTLLSDQDNGLVFAAADAEAERPRWLAFGRRVNDVLAACGYPLCDGRVMAGQPPCCLTIDEWTRRFEHWMAHGSGNDLLAARIYFDLRPVAGRLEIARPLLELLCSPAAAVPRFVKQMADVVLCNHVPLNWWGRVLTTTRHGRAMFDLKMSGTALFVDAARLWALAHGIAETGTVPRLRAAASVLGVPAQETEDWVAGFLALQRLRLQAQRGRPVQADSQERAWADWDGLDEGQRRELKHALRIAGWVQQRIALDYRR